METQGKNVSLAGYDHTKTEAMETVMNIFEQADNHSYTICFLGSRSSTIFEKKGNAQAPITIKEVEEIVEAIFDEFLASKSLKNLKIITNGATGGGIPEIVVKKFNKIRRDKEVDLKEKNKQIQLIAITSFQGRKVRLGAEMEGIKENAFTKDHRLYQENNVLNEENDLYIKVKDEISQMISLAEFFIFLPGGKKTLEQLRYTYDYLSQLDDDELSKYRILSHSFWDGEIKKKRNSIYFSPLMDEISSEEIFTHLKSKNNIYIAKFSKYENKIYDIITNIKELTEKIIHSFFTMPLQADDIRGNAILAVDFTYLLDNELSDKKIYKEIYCRNSYIRKLNEFYENGGNYLFLVEEGKNDEYKIITFPSAKLQSQEKLNYQERAFNYKEKFNFFEDFANYWEKEEYGQTLVWKYNRIRTENSEVKMIFSIVLLFNCILPEQILEDLRSMLDQFIFSFSSKKVSEYFHISNQELQKREQKVYERSVRHAISQVFVRNMSHNIISHVLVNLQSEESLKKENLQEIINKGTYEGIDIENKDKVLSIEYQLAVLNKYISNRCLYLNEATYSVSNFVESKKVYKDLFKGLDENRILLNLISAVDNFKYRFRFLYRDREINEKEDIAVMIPGGVLGQQAFYNIIENMIRNTAKHNAFKVSKEVTFTVAFVEPIVMIDYLKEKTNEILTNIGKFEGMNSFKQIKNIEKNFLENEEIKAQAGDIYNIIKENPDIGIDNEVFNLHEEEFEILGKKITINKEDYQTKEENFIIDKERQLSVYNFKKMLGKDWISLLVQLYGRMLDKINRYYEVIIYNDVVLEEKEADNILNNIYNGLRGEVLEGDTLRTHSLGLLEMKASAAFLRQIDIVKIEEGILSYTDEAQHIFFMGLIKLRAEGGFNIGYRFFLKKVEKYLIVCHLKEDYQEKIAKWSAIGIELISVEDFLGKIERKESFSHEFVLLLTQEAKDSVGTIGEYFYSNHKEKRENRRNDRIPELSLLPERLMYIEEDFLSEVGETQIEEFFSQKIWEQWEGTRKEDKDKNKNYLAINTSILKTGLFANYDDCKQVVFHNHLYSMKDWENVIKGIDEKNKGKITVEPLSSAAQRKLPYFDIYQSSLDNYVIEIRKNDKYFITQQLIEAYFNKVIVIDERIQKFASAPFFTEGNKTLYQRDIFDHINVLMPKAEEVDLNNESLSDEYIQRIEEFIIENIPESEFLVVHYGLFERIYGKENHNEVLNSKLLEWSKMIRTIVVTGRGQHTLEGLPEAVNYLNLSSLLDAFRDNRNKYSINYILNQTRR